MSAPAPQKPSLAHSFGLMRRYLAHEGLALSLLALLVLLNIALQIIGPQLVRSFLDTARAGGKFDTIALLFLAATLGELLFSTLATAQSTRLAWNTTNALRLDLVKHLLSLDLRFFGNRSPGELIERVDGDVSALASFFSSFVVKVVANILLLIGILLVLFREDWRLGLVFSLFAIAVLTIFQLVRQRAIVVFKAQREAKAQYTGFLGEHLAATEDLRANGATGYSFLGENQHFRILLPISLRAGKMGISLWVASILCFSVGTALTFALCSWLYRDGAITLGTAYLIFSYVALLEHPIEELRRELEQLQRAEASVARVFELFGQQSSLDNSGQTILPQRALTLAFRQLSFAYSDDSAAVLHNISLNLAPGQVLGVIGRTGSGKSTLAKLLLRFYDPQQGVIELDGHNLRDLPLAHLRERVAIVTQEVQLFHATVRDNLRFFDEKIDDRQLLQAIDTIGLAAWLAKLPQGLDSLIEPDGISAGEAQLLAFARIFLRDPGLIILDEATSRLDPATETQLELALDQLLKNRSAVIIAHRLSTLERANQLLLLEAGRVIEHGSRLTLAANPDSHYSMLKNSALAAVDTLEAIEASIEALSTDAPITTAVMHP
jgi:ATP-binding cassette, subfamily B, bacterial